jgi:hypothetical protein
MKSKMIFLMVTFLVIITAPLAFAAIWDVQNDFSITNNPTGAWSYGWESAPGGTFNLYTHVAVIGTYDGTAPAWYDTTNQYGWNTPSVWQNTTTGVVWFHPGPSPIDVYPSSTGKYSVIRWTSPVSGTIAINGMFGAGDTYLMSYFIYNGTTSFFEVHGTFSDAPFSLTESISIGDTIDFMIGEYHWGGATPLYATIVTAPVPEPSTMLLLGSGLVGLVGYGRRRMKK